MNKIYHCFPEGKHKVFTMSYDDGRRADEKLIGIMNQYGIRGSFHLNSGLLEDGDRICADEVKALYAGHEVSVHTVSHPTMARSPKEEIIEQIMEDRKALENLVDYPVRGMSYPNGSYNKQIVDLLPHLGIEYARVVGGHANFHLPEDFYRWQSTCHHNRDALQHAKTFVELNKKQYLYCFYVWGHSYEFDNDNNWELIEELCKTVGGKEDTWYATNIEIVDYMKALERLKFDVARKRVINDSCQSVWIDDNGIIKEIKPGLTELSRIFPVISIKSFDGV